MDTPLTSPTTPQGQPEIQTEASPTARSLDNKLWLHWSATLCLLAAAFALPFSHYLAGYRTGTLAPAEILVPRMAGQFLVVLLFGVGPGWVVWRLTHRRMTSSIVVTITSTLLLLGSFGHYQQTMQRHRRNALFNEMVKSSRQMAEINRRQSEGEDVGDSPADLIRKNIQSMRDHVKTSGGDEALAVKALAEVFDELAQVRTHFDRAIQALANDGPLDPNRLMMPGAIDSHLALVDRAIECNEQYDASCADMADRMKQQLQAAGMSRQYIDGYMLVRVPLVRRIRNDQRIILASQRKLLTLLKDQAGQWAPDTDGKSFVFYDRSAIEQFNQCLADIDEATRDAQASQSKLAEEQQKALNALHASNP